MKTIGLIGGTGWISTQEYYRYINEMTNQKLGGLNFAQCLLYSFNYAEINARNRIGDFEGVHRLVLDAAIKLQSIGAECLLLCANTLHQFADDLICEIDVPLIHVAEATAREINSRNIAKVGLLGTKITMEADFYKTKILQKGIEAVVPEKDDRDFIHTVILDELLKNIILEKSKRRFHRIIDDLKMRGAEGIILGCTEIPLLVKPEDIDLPAFDTLQIHCRAAVDFALT